MTATIEKTKEQRLKEFNEWYDKREAEEPRLSREEMWAKVDDLDIEMEFISQEVHAARRERREKEMEMNRTAR